MAHVGDTCPLSQVRENSAKKKRETKNLINFKTGHCFLRSSWQL